MEINIPEAVKSPEMAGIAGALVGLKFLPGATWAERVFNLFAGILCAAFGAPGIVEWLHINNKAILMACAFLVGLFGLSLCSAVVDAIKNLQLAEIIKGWISRR